MNLRPATEKDLPALFALEQGVVEAERPFNPVIRDKDVRYYDIEALIQSAQAELLVMEHHNQLIACGYVQIRSSKQQYSHDIHGYLGFMYVSPEYRGQGLNQTVMKQLMNWAQAQGVEYFYLDVYAQNQAALSAYEKLGFRANLVEMQLQVGEPIS